MDPEDAERLPHVRWGEHRVSRLLVGHNPLKGQSHHTDELSGEMREWFDPKLGRDVELLRRCEECGINTVQFGGAAMHSLLRRHAEEGGRIQWIATFYDTPGGLEEELKAILSVDPKPIGIQYFGERTDSAFLSGRMGEVREKLKRLRETGLLLGVCSHLADAVDHVESAGWDVDFYETCFYAVYSHAREQKINRGEELYDDADRERMVRVIRQVSKPCIAFKVLAANRNCGSAEEVASALRFAYGNIKETDVVLVGMWQKHKDQVAENARLAREILFSTSRGGP